MGLKGLWVKTIDLVGLLHWHPRACSISCPVYSFNCSSNCNINIQMYSNGFPFSVHPTNKQISSCDNLQPDAARDKPSWRQTRLSDTWLLLNHRSRWSQNVVVYHHWPIDDAVSGSSPDRNVSFKWAIDFLYLYRASETCFNYPVNIALGQIMKAHFVGESWSESDPSTAAFSIFNNIAE